MGMLYKVKPVALHHDILIGLLCPTGQIIRDETYIVPQEMKTEDLSIMNTKGIFIEAHDQRPPWNFPFSLFFPEDTCQNPAVTSSIENICISHVPPSISLLVRV